MIKHYILLSAVITELNDGEYLEVDIDHAGLLGNFGGVAFDEDNKKWLSPSQLSPEDAANDSIFLNYISGLIRGEDDETT